MNDTPEEVINTLNELTWGWFFLCERQNSNQFCNSIRYDGNCLKSFLDRHKSNVVNKFQAFAIYQLFKVVVYRFCCFYYFYSVSKFIIFSSACCYNYIFHVHLNQYYLWYPLICSRYVLVSCKISVVEIKSKDLLKTSQISNFKVWHHSHRT